MLSSKNDSKVEGRFAARLDVLTERIDTLASTVATTASAMAKRDGEIASLRKELQARDDKLHALAVAAQGGVAPTELRELREAVTALSGERSKRGSTKQLEDLMGKVGLLGQRLETLSTTVATTAAGLSGREGEIAAIRKRLDAAPTATSSGAVADAALQNQIDELLSAAASTAARLDAQAAELVTLKTHAEQRASEPERPSEELSGMLATLRTQVEALAGLRSGASEDQLEELRARVEALADVRSGVTEAQLDERFAETDAALTQLAQRMEAVSGNMEALSRDVAASASSLGDRELELAALHRHFTESSTRIESVVDDIKEALSAVSDMGSVPLEHVTTQIERAAADVASLATRIDRIDTTLGEMNQNREQGSGFGELARRVDAVDQRVAAVATEVTRAKTLWPVALRSLEARLDDAVSHPRPPDPSPTHPPDATPEPAGSPAETPDDSSDDLLASLRDSLHAMETVAAEMARASDTLEATDDDAEDEPVAAAGGTIVPLRATEP